MKSPFKIFPNIGYKNSQFQIVSKLDNLKIDIFYDETIVTSVVVNKDHPTLMTNLKSPGKFIAKCRVADELFQQEIEIKNAIRIGSSQYKKAFLFDDNNFSFILMKDRLLLFDEKKKLLLTQNHYSPSEIHKIDEFHFLFITKIGGFSDGIINLGIYNTNTFSIVGELLNHFREIIIIPESNKTWLYNTSKNSIHCFELIDKNEKYFTELRRFENFNDYFIDNSNKRIYVTSEDTVIISDLINLLFTFEIPRRADNAIDREGNIFKLRDGIITFKNNFIDLSLDAQLLPEINLQSDNFLHIGSTLQQDIHLLNLQQKVDQMKDGIITHIPQGQTFHYHILPELDQITESHKWVHDIYSTDQGVYLVVKEEQREVREIKFTKEENEWQVSPLPTIRNEYSLLFWSSSKVDILIDKEPYLNVYQHLGSMLLVNTQNGQKLFVGINQFHVGKNNSIEVFLINDISYYLIKSIEKYSLYKANDLKSPILDQVEILNPHLINKHKIIYYTGSDKYISKANYLNAFDLKECTKLFIKEIEVKHSIFKDATDFKFHENYALSSNKVLFNPTNLEIKDAFIGLPVSFSAQLNKIISFRDNLIYLSEFNPELEKYELIQIEVETHNYKESYLSPNGQFLMLQDESNKYLWYDINKNEYTHFYSGKFLAFRNDGSLIVEDDSTRAVKILDPKIFEDITPPNYHHYRFISPDGKLYAQVASKTRFYHKLNEKILTLDEVKKIRRELDDPLNNAIEEDKLKLIIKNNRKEIFDLYKSKFHEIGIKDYNAINSNHVVKVERYTEIGIIGTQTTAEIVFPEDLQFYNYSAFSYDNKYFGYVGKPSMNGLLHLFKIDFDEANSKLTVLESYSSRYPRYASWVCGFSKKGYFATYDSTPDTYIINVDDDLFEKKISVMELKQNIRKSKTNIYNSYNKWNEITGKNFLCFSPTGDFLALSEQGYEPLTHGGYGHQESSAVHIANTITGEIVNSFTEHGAQISSDKDKKVTFVAFSEDESRLMSLSSDGVVIIRDLLSSN